LAPQQDGAADGVEAAEELLPHICADDDHVLRRIVFLLGEEAPRLEFQAEKLGEIRRHPGHRGGFQVLVSV